MRVIPVLDLVGGVVVRAVAGRRSEYRPIRSPLVESADPSHVAARLLAVSGARELYVADLDAITTGQPVASEVRAFVAGLGVGVLLDGGFRTPPTELGTAVRPVIASETFGKPAAARTEWVYSIDLKGGIALGSASDTPLSLAEAAVAAGYRTLIVLDLARVGTGTGPGTLDLLRDVRKQFPAIELIAGGGVRDRDDLARLTDAGADAALVASALHDGRWR